jgi:PAS domain S-box-containing protein
MLEEMTGDPRVTGELSLSEIGSTLLAVAEQARMGLVITALDPGGAVTPILLSQAAVDIFGRTREELMSGNLLELLAEEERGKAAEIVQHLLAREATAPFLESVVVHASGRRIPIEATFVQVAHGDRILTVNVLFDISKRKALEDELARAGRLAAMGTLAAGVAHEINNPLTFMALRTEKLRRLVDEAMPDDGRRAEALLAVADIENGVNRVASIIRGLLTLSRDDESEEEVVDLWSVIDAADQLVGHEVRRRARVTIERSALPLVKVNAYRLEQVFANLLVNAAQAFESPGERNLVRLHAGLLADGAVFVDIHDNGPGIPGAVVGRIFDPFFTSKPIGTGTGLGLSISQAILARLGGQLTVESTVGRGSTFRVALPASRVVAEATPEAGSRPARPVRRGRLLVIDDEAAIGESLVSLLGDDYEVDVELSGEPALERIYASAPYDIILCDLMMGGLSGVDVYEQLVSARPGLERRIVFMTGGAVTERARSFVARIPNTCLAKPFTLAELETALQAAMDVPRA